MISSTLRPQTMPKLDANDFNSAALDEIADKVPPKYFKKPKAWKQDDVYILCTVLCHLSSLQIATEMFISRRSMTKTQLIANYKSCKVAKNKLEGFINIIETDKCFVNNPCMELAGIKMLLQKGADSYNTVANVYVSSCNNDTKLHAGRKVGQRKSGGSSITLNELEIKLSSVLRFSGVSKVEPRAEIIHEIFTNQNIPLSTVPAIASRLRTAKS